MIVTRRFKADKNRTSNRCEFVGQSVVIRLCRHHGQPSAAPAFRPLYQHFLAVLGHVDRYQYGIGESRKAFGHGRSRSKVLSRQPHFRDLLTGHGRRDGALRYAGLRAPSASSNTTFPMCYGIQFRYLPG